MTVLIIGIPYFAELLRSQLSTYKPGWDFRCLKQYSGRLRNVRTAWAIATSDVVYVIGGSSEPNAAIKLALCLRKRVVMHWVGTDVIDARSALEEGRDDKRSVDGIVHCCEVDWIQQEMEDIGIKARQVPLAAISLDETPIPERRDLSILSYVGKNRETFYGMPRLIRLAKLFPDVPFRLAGSEAINEPVPRNVTLLGWVDDMTREYKLASHYLRLPQHDGLAFSVLEALRWGCEVGYSCPFPYTHHIKNDEDANAFLSHARTKMSAGLWTPNLAGHAYVKKHFNQGDVLERLLKVFTGSEQQLFQTD